MRNLTATHLHPLARVAFGLVLVAAGLVASLAAAHAAGMWDKGAQWATLKAGYAKAAVENSADGSLGFGVGYTRFLRKQWSAGLQFHYEVLGRYRGPAEVEMPLTIESAYHFNWPTDFKPYLGLGGGVFFHQYKFTGADENQTRSGAYLLTGFDLPLSERALLGAEVRTVGEMDAQSDNPYFVLEDKTAIHWSVKVTYSRSI